MVNGNKWGKLCKVSQISPRMQCDEQTIIIYSVLTLQINIQVTKNMPDKYNIMFHVFES